MLRRASSVRFLVAALAVALLAAPAASAAGATEPWQAYQQLDTGLFDLQLGDHTPRSGQSDQALGQVRAATTGLAESLGPVAPAEAARLRRSVVDLETALAARGEAPVAVAAARTQTAALAGSFAAAVAEARRGQRRRGAAVVAGAWFRGSDEIQPPGRWSHSRGEGRSRTA